MPQAALYYPDWSVNDPGFLFESLLYWDRLACITPYEGFERRPIYETESDLAHALIELNDRFVSGIVPTAEQQHRVHERLQFFLEQEPPEWCRPENLKPERRTVFSAWKFSEPTISLLRERGWIRKDSDVNDPLKLQTIADAAANVLLAELAAECGSESLPPITSDAGSFRASCNTLLFELGAKRGLGAVKEPHEDEAKDYAFVLCSIARLGVQDGEIGATELRRLYELRMDDGFDAQRRAFREKVDAYVDALRAAPPNERQLLVDEWRNELDRDRAGLKRELQTAGLRSLVDKEGLIALVLGGGAGTAFLGPLGTAIGVTAAAARAVFSARESRRGAMERHWTSWLFSLERPRLALW